MQGNCDELTHVEAFRHQALFASIVQARHRAGIFRAGIFDPFELHDELCTTTVQFLSDGYVQEPSSTTALALYAGECECVQPHAEVTRPVVAAVTLPHGRHTPDDPKVPVEVAASKFTLPQ